MDTKSSYTEKLEVAVGKKKEELTAYEPYKPDEMFRFKGENIFSVEDFWQYAYSQLDGMAETIAEFLVAKAFGIKKAENVNYWTAYAWHTEISASRSRQPAMFIPGTKRYPRYGPSRLHRQTTATGKTRMQSGSYQGSQRYMYSA